MELKIYNVQKLIILFYIVIPLIFFTVPLFFVYETGEFKVHFYSTFLATLDGVLTILIGHLLLGILIYYLFKATNFEIKIYRKNILNDIASIICFVLLMFSHGIVTMLAGSLLFIIFANSRIYNLTYFFLLMLGFLNLLIHGERVLFVFALLAWSLRYISKISIGKLIILGIVGLFGLVYILQPLKYGEMPFSNFTNPLEGLSYLLQHVFPIYYTAFLSNTIDFSTTSLLVEFVPFGKSLSGELGIVERLAIEGLPANIISEGGRLGSNSAMYFSYIGATILFLMFFVVKSNMCILRSQMLINSYLIYFIIQGPYFIRRSFASFTIDLIIITFWVILISFILMIVKNKKRKLRKNEYIYKCYK